MNRVPRVTVIDIRSYNGGLPKRGMLLKNLFSQGTDLVLEHFEQWPSSGHSYRPLFRLLNMSY